MNKIAIILLLPLMIFSAAIHAQKVRKQMLQWRIAAELPPDNSGQVSPGFAGPVTGVHQNRFLVAGGANFPDSMPWNGGKKRYHQQAYVYRWKAGKLLLDYSGILPQPVAYAANCVTAKGIVYAGGENEQGISKKVFLVTLQEKEHGVGYMPLPDLPVAVTNASAIAIGSSVYLAGGETANGVSDQFLLLDLDNTDAGWQVMPVLPAPVSHSILLKHNANVYLIGGRMKRPNDTSVFYSKVAAFDTNTRAWKEKANLPYALSAGTGIVHHDKIFIFGGDKGITFHKTETLINAIANSKDENEKARMTEEKAVLQNRHPGFSNEVLVYDLVTDKWDTAGFIPFPAPVTTTALTWNGYFFLPSGEIKAGVRSPFILSAKPLRK
ncbi:hypothetical protein [Parasegetibacter sp. NRK P23]|uniref:Kelch repeat-containing protein n=1 Tax=Parasegetibacter sp. NRK P23 TaxID=2942999 RepID=UPI0020444973|nr:hypothetical protein [Parasegetibacter sp. NRK P23]MCM5528296.1 hypothetical protein [Parasegetibacter sp. NRK P23]